MRQVRFPPFGFEISEFGLREPFKTLFLAFFDFQKKIISEIKVQKDAPGPISPLRVRIGGVWAAGALFLPVFGVFRFAEKLNSASKESMRPSSFRSFKTGLIKRFSAYSNDQGVCIERFEHFFIHSKCRRWLQSL